MAVGDDAKGAGYPLVPDTGEEGRVRWGAREINRTRDYIAQIKNSMSAIWPVAKGGTGASTAAQALANLGGSPAGHTHSASTLGSSGLGFATNVDAAIGWLNANKAGASHGHSTSQISGLDGALGAKANAVDDVNQAIYARGTFQAHNREAGANRYAVYVDGGYIFGRATSSRRYKEDIEPWEIDPKDVLALRPVKFHRKVDPDGVLDYGMIAEETHETLPEIVQYYQGESDDAPVIDGIHYELLSVALLAVVKDQQARIEDLERRMAGEEAS